MRDAAAAAAMSDPNRNPHFRRRWMEFGAAVPSGHPACGTVGTFRLALQEAFTRRRRAEQAQVVASNNSDPPK